MRSVVEDHEGSGDATLLLGHATGFCKETWRPVVRELRTLGVDAPIVAWDAAGHGAAAPYGPDEGWWRFGTDLVALIDRLKPTGRLVGVGHSMGGAAVTMAEVLRPGTFEALVLIEPVIMPPPYDTMPEFPLALKAAKRRGYFPSRDAARARYRMKTLFARWDALAFDGYLEGGLVDADDGVVLSCAPATEADVFAGSADHALFERLDEVGVPVRLVISDDPGTGLIETMHQLPHRIPNVTTSYLAGQNHLVVMERPALVAREIAAALDP